MLQRPRALDPPPRAPSGQLMWIRQVCVCSADVTRLIVQTGECYPNHPVRHRIVQAAKESTSQGVDARWGDADLETSCGKSTTWRINLTHGVFIWVCATCKVQIGFSLMDRSEGPSVPGKIAITRFWGWLTGAV